VEPWGLAGDRRWLVVDHESGKAITQRDTTALTQVYPALAKGALILRTPGSDNDLVVDEPVGGDQFEVTVWAYTGMATLAGAAADDWLSTRLDRKVRLVWMDDPTRRPVKPGYGLPTDRLNFSDGFPVMLANAASLNALNDLIVESDPLEGPLPMTRFRPSVVMSGARPWVEDGWTDGRLRIGDVMFRVPKRADRCVVTTTDQETGIRGKEPLRTLARHRNVDQKLYFGTHLIPERPGQIAVGDEIEAMPA
jgi:uncharacterized protein YcbX